MKKIVLLMLFSLTAGLFAEQNISGDFYLHGSLGDLDEGKWNDLWMSFEPQITLQQEDIKLLASGKMEVQQGLWQPEFDLGLLNLDFSGATGRWIIGQQEIRWGQSLALPVLDVICPRDYSNLFSGDPRESVVPVPALSWSYDLNWAMVEALYIFQHRPNVLPLAPGDSLPDGVEFREASDVIQGPADGEYGTRLRFFLPFGDLGLALYYGWEDTPLYLQRIEMQEDNAVLVVSEDYYRLFLSGLDAAIPMGPLLFRLETAMLWNRSFAPSDVGQSTLKSHQWMGLLGVDWMDSQWNIVTEIMSSYRLQEGQYVEEEPMQCSLAGELAYSSFSGLWQWSISGLFNMINYDWYTGVKMSHSPYDGLNLEIGVGIPRGDEDFFSTVEEDYMGYLNCRYSF
ncbi:MAG: hypothetical protein PF447_10930 [Spirochaetaceae bacterium]|jgi:hypothetical protein|nr:hypothetical protein [Spirochaetaceae bacterium]